MIKEAGKIIGAAGIAGSTMYLLNGYFNGDKKPAELI